MRTPNVFRLLAFASLAGLFAFPLPAQEQQNGDDVAAAARKSREQAKSAPKPKKVVTNDDLPKAPDTTPAAPTGAAAPKPEGQAAASADTAAAADEEKGETYWRKRFQEIHDKIDSAQKELDVLQRELNKDQLQYYPDPQKAMMQQHDRSDINDKTAKIDAKRKEIESLTQQLSDLEDELRKSGGNPGWAR